MIDSPDGGTDDYLGAGIAVTKIPIRMWWLSATDVYNVETAGAGDARGPYTPEHVASGGNGKLALGWLPAPNDDVSGFAAQYRGWDETNSRWGSWTTKYLGPDARTHTFTGLADNTYEARVVSRELRGGNPLEVSVSFTQDEYKAAEDGTVQVTMQLSAAPGRTVTVPIASFNQGGVADSDYSGIPASVTFAAHETEKSFTFTATADTDDDDGESVRLVVYDLPRRVTGTGVTTVRIEDDDGDPFIADGSFWSAVYHREVTVGSAKSGNPPQVPVIHVESRETGTLQVRWDAVDVGTGSEVYAYSVRTREWSALQGSPWMEQTIYDYPTYPTCYLESCGDERQVLFEGLISGREYNIQIQSHNANGSSAWKDFGPYTPR